MFRMRGVRKASCGVLFLILCAVVFFAPRLSRAQSEQACGDPLPPGSISCDESAGYSDGISYSAEDLTLLYTSEGTTPFIFVEGRRLEVRLQSGMLDLAADFPLLSSDQGALHLDGSGALRAETADASAIIARGDGQRGVYLRLREAGSVVFDIKGDVTAHGTGGTALFAENLVSENAGTIDMDVAASAAITAMGMDSSYGVHARASGGGAIDIDISGDISAEGLGSENHAIYALSRNGGGVAIDLLAEGSAVARGEMSHGIYAVADSDSDVDITIRDATLGVSGQRSNAVEASVVSGDLTADIAGLSARLSASGDDGIVVHLYADGSGELTLNVGAGAVLCAGSFNSEGLCVARESAVAIFMDRAADEAGEVSISNAGEIIGDVLGTDGNDSFTILPGGRFLGDVNLSQGSDSFTNRGTFVLDGYPLLTGLESFTQEEGGVLELIFVGSFSDALIDVDSVSFAGRVDVSDFFATERIALFPSNASLGGGIGVRGGDAAFINNDGDSLLLEKIPQGVGDNLIIDSDVIAPSFSGTDAVSLFAAGAGSRVLRMAVSGARIAASGENSAALRLVGVDDSSFLGLQIDADSVVCAGSFGLGNEENICSASTASGLRAIMFERDSSALSYMGGMAGNEDYASSLTNLGTIVGDIVSGAGVGADFRHEILNRDGGEIRGNIISGDGGDVFENEGAFTGSLSMGGGDDSARNSGTMTLTSLSDFGGGTADDMTNAGTITIRNAGFSHSVNIGNLENFASTGALSFVIEDTDFLRDASPFSAVHRTAMLDFASIGSAETAVDLSGTIEIRAAGGLLRPPDGITIGLIRVRGGRLSVASDIVIRYDNLFYSVASLTPRIDDLGGFSILNLLVRADFSGEGGLPSYLRGLRPRTASSAQEGESGDHPVLRALLSFGAAQERTDADRESAYARLLPGIYDSARQTAWFADEAFTRDMLGSSCFAGVSRSCAWAVSGGRALRRGTAPSYGSQGASFSENAFRVSGGAQFSQRQWRAIFGIGYENGSLKGGGVLADQSGDADRYLFGAALLAPPRFLRGFDIDAALTVGYSSHDYRRSIGIGSLSSVAGDVDLFHAGGEIGVRRLMPLGIGMPFAGGGGEWVLIPQLKAKLIGFFLSSFTEKGGAAALRQEGSDDLYFSMTPSLEFRYDLGRGDGSLFRFGAGFTQFLSGADSAYQTRFASASPESGSFTTRSAMEGSLANVNAALDIGIFGKTRFLLEYRGSVAVGGRTETHEAIMRLRYAF